MLLWWMRARRKLPIIGARRARMVPSSLGLEESGSGWLSDMTPTTIASRTKATRVWVRNKRASRARSPGVLSCEMSRSYAMDVLAKGTPDEWRGYGFWLRLWWHVLSD